MAASPGAVALVNSPERQSDLESLKQRHSSLFHIDRSFSHEIKKLLRLGLPIGFAISTRIGQSLTDQAVVGHLGHDSEYLAATGLAQVWMTISGTFLYAFAGGISVLSSQAFGARNYLLVSQWFHVGAVLLFFLTLPAIAAWMYTEDALLFFGTDAHTARLAGRFASWSTISLIPNTQFMAVRMYFKSQSLVMPATVVCAIFLVLNLFFNLVLVYGLVARDIGRLVGWEALATWQGLGYIGSPLATATTRILQPVCYCVYMFGCRRHHKKTWSSCSNTNTYCHTTFSCNNRVTRFMKISIPQMLSQTLEDWQIQIITLFVSHLNNADVAAFVSLITMILLVHCIVMGMQNAVSVRIGNALGAGMWKNAKYTAKVGIILGATIGVVVAAVFALCAQELGKLVSNDAKVIQIYKELMPIVAATLVFLALFTIQLGILLGQARTVSLAICALVSCWLIAVPMSYILGICLSYGIRGVMIGIIVGYGAFWASSLVLVLQSDWQKLAKDAVNRSIAKNEANEANEATKPMMTDEHNVSVNSIKSSNDYRKNNLNVNQQNQDQFKTLRTKDYSFPPS